MPRELTQSQLEQMEAEEALKRKQLTPEKFLIEIESYCSKYDHSILDGVVEYCNENDLDPEFVAKELISDRLYALLQEDAESKHLIEKTKRIKFK